MGQEQYGKQAKKWKDMTRKERATTIVALVIVALIITFVAKAMSDSGSTPDNTSSAQNTDTTSTAQASQPSTTQQISAWYGQYGYILQTFATDASKTSTDAQNGDVTAVGDDCAQLRGDVTTAQGFPAIPDPQTASDFSSALSYYADGTQDCIDGANNYDASLISKAAGEISKGNTQMGVAANDIKKLATN